MLAISSLNVRWVCWVWDCVDNLMIFAIGSFDSHSWRHVWNVLLSIPNIGLTTVTVGINVRLVDNLGSWNIVMRHHGIVGLDYLLDDGSRSWFWESKRSWCLCSKLWSLLFESPYFSGSGWVMWTVILV